MNSKVMIIDDDASFRDLARMIFQDRGIHIIEAVNGEEALELILREKPDIVLLDLLLPGIDGYEVLHKLKNNPSTEKIPVVICSTTFRDEKKVHQAKSSGAADYIRKPIRPAELVRRVEKVLSQR